MKTVEEIINSEWHVGDAMMDCCVCCGDAIILSPNQHIKRYEDDDSRFDSHARIALSKHIVDLHNQSLANKEQS